MEELKKIIAVFIKKDAETISDDTLINLTAIPGSILIHRMYAAINKAGYKVQNYSNINTYGDLVLSLNDTSIEKVNIGTKIISNNQEAPGGAPNSIIGVDIESIANLPITNDFREHEFYTNNFSAHEIAFSLIKPNPYETFAGLFSAKEALCKVNNILRERPFSEIEIQHTADGRPVFQNYSISISHSQSHSVAVALLTHTLKQNDVKANGDERENIPLNEAVVSTKYNKMSMIALVISLVSVLSILILLYFDLIKSNVLK